MMKRLFDALVIGAVLVGCTSMAYDDKVYVMDAPLGRLRGKTEKDDRDLRDCDPEKLPGGKLKYKCVAHFISDYQRLLEKINTLEGELKACQGQ